MALLINFIDHHLAYAVTWTIVNSFWQGSIIALFMSFIHAQTKKGASFKYNVSIGSLLILFISSCITFVYYYSEGSASSGLVDKPSIAGGSILNTVENVGTFQSVNSWFNFHSETIILVWGVGVILFLLKLLFSWAYVHYLKTGEENKQLTYSMVKIKERLKLEKPIKILESSRITVPMVIGIIKPVILFPVGVITLLSIEEIEGIIAHELAHVKRHDFLVNIIQTIMETLYYYHPAVWWISANIKSERENCCDDVAISLGMEPITYAKALVKLREIQTQKNPALAMALSSSNRNQLLNRIKRIMNMQQTKNNIREKSIATIFLLAAALLFSTEIISAENSKGDKTIPSVDLLPLTDHPIAYKGVMNIKPSLVPQTTVRDTVPRSKSRVSIQTEKNGKVMKLEKENGEITRLEVDGKVIPKSEYEDYKDITDDVIILDGTGGNRMMFFGGGEDFNFDFDGVFDNNRIQELLKGFERDFAFPEINGFQMMQEPFLEFDEEQMETFKKEMENLGDKLKLEEKDLLEFEKMMENLGGQFENLRIDTSFIFDFRENEELGDRLQFFLGENEDGKTQWFEDNFSSKNSRTVADVIGAELNRDGLLEPYQQNKVELTGKYLKINGDKQPKNIWGKYKRLYEEQTGMMMSKKARIDFEVEGKKSNRKIRTF